VKKKISFTVNLARLLGKLPLIELGRAQSCPELGGDGALGRVGGREGEGGEVSD
jgi:hypothetical protein